MSETERAQVGKALDALRDALNSYVDVAMVEAYGQEWDDVVAAEDARRRSNRRKFPVSKNDLAVLLKVIIHRKIAPWSDLGDLPRVRAYASEVLTLRNLYAHGDDCTDEHARVVDTAGRLLRLLNLPVPADLTYTDAPAAQVPAEVLSMVPGSSEVTISAFDAEILQLGEPARRFIELHAKSAELEHNVLEKFKEESAALDLTDPDFDALQTRMNATIEAVGAGVVSLLEALHDLRNEYEGTLDDGQLAVASSVRGAMLNRTLEVSVRLYESNMELRFVESFRDQLEARPQPESVDDWKNDLEKLENDPERRELQDRLDKVRRLAPHDETREDRVRETVQFASKLEDSSALSNLLIALGSFELADVAIAAAGDGNEPSDALPLLRDASERFRLLAAMEPGSIAESALVVALRKEGELLNDLGRPDEAVRAFARADEIIDRYPAADPNLMQ